MNEDQITLMAIQATITDLPLQDRKMVTEAAAKIRHVVAEYPKGHGQMALALVGAYFAASPDEC
ncbi:hypothetical protein [Iodobacter sp.]|uniref:hypothetical protein n=1 Tax=Iodobacter sp. TaxID=1915058 RepID=UPI0025F9AAD2|nr:hypothetical protein [Iodobacter sp.]